MKKSTLIFSLLLFQFYFTGAQQTISRKSIKAIDDLLSTEFKPGEPGIALLIAQRGKVLYEKGVGTANMELNVPLQPGMIFRVGSITKQFTAIGILQLAEQHKLSLKDSVQQYIKDFPPKRHTITIEHLLTHTSGLKDYMSIDHPGTNVERWDFTPQFLINHFKNLPLEFEPGTKYAYTNSGYVLLAAIIEKVSGKPYHKYMRENVIQPAGLKNTYFADESTVIPGRVTGYTRDKGYYQNTEYQSLSVGFGCGDLLSTVGDLYQWNRSLLSYKLVKKETLEKAFTPFVLENGDTTNYGYGWIIDQLHGSRCIHHEGQVSGFIAQELYFPGEDIFVALATNLKSGEDKTDFSNKRFELFYQLSRLALGKEISGNPVISEKLLSSYEGVYALDSTEESNFHYIRKEDGHLVIVVPPNRKIELIPLAANQFKMKNIRSEAIITFVNDDQKKITGLVSLQKGKFMYQKVKGSDRAYAGRYEAGPQYHDVEEENGQLTISSNAGLPRALTHISENRFLLKGSGIERTIEFFKKDGKVRGLIIIQESPVKLMKIK